MVPSENSTTFFIRELDVTSPKEIRLVAERMRLTLIEVLGSEVGEKMYTMEWLIDRVKQHLDPDRYTGRVFVSEDENGQITGHTIVRLEPDDEGGFIGLFSTTYVEPLSRRLGIAAELLKKGEAWMKEQGMLKAVTYTDADNRPLKELYLEHGYQAANMPNNFIVLSKSLTY